MKSKRAGRYGSIAVAFLLALAALMVFSAPTQATTGASIQQSTFSYEASTPTVLSLSNPVTPGDMIIVLVAADGGAITVTDDASPPSNYVAASVEHSGTEYAAVFYAVAGSSPPGSVTVALAASTSAFDVYLMEVSGLAARPSTGVVGTGSDCNPITSCTITPQTSSASYGSGAFLVAAIASGQYSATTGTETTGLSSSFSDLNWGIMLEWGAASASGSTAFSTSFTTSAVSNFGSWVEAGAVFPLPGAVTTTTSSPSAGIPPIPTKDMPNVLTLATYGGGPVTGHRVGTIGSGQVIYNIPSINQTLLNEEVAQGNFALLPNAVTYCSEGTSIRVSGFFASWWDTPLTNSTEFAFGFYESFVTPSQGWPSEPACSG